jgi:ribosome biogenesis GTPase A
VETVLKGVVRAERLETPSDFIPAILARVRKEYVQRQYLIREWDDANDFLCKLAMRNGKLLKGGEPDIHSVSINIINDWQRVSLSMCSKSEVNDHNASCSTLKNEFAFVGKVTLLRGPSY